MKKLKITTVEREYRTVWVELTEGDYETLEKAKPEKAREWAEAILETGDYPTEHSDFTEPEMCFVDREDGEPLYED